MTWTNKVIWTEGMFLQPQHLQQHDRFLGQQAQMRFAATSDYGWGFLSLSLDSAALSLGKIALTAAQGVMPDGLAFDVPGQDPAPAALDVPPDAQFNSAFSSGQSATASEPSFIASVSRLGEATEPESK